MIVCRSLEKAVETVAEVLNNAVKPVLVGGVKLRPRHAEEAFRDLADACGEPFYPSITLRFPLRQAQADLAESMNTFSPKNGRA